MVVPPGRVYGFLGRNGAGKSTALRIIMGITEPSAGTVQLFGQPLRGEQPDVRQRIGYVAQESSYYGWMTALSLGRFVSGFYPSWDEGEYRRLLAGLEVPDERRIQTLSGGNHAKLALAVALAHRPELLVLDEPTAGMDAVARQEFIEIVKLQAERSGRTTLFSSHLIDEVEQAADLVGIVDRGRMLWQGAPADLQKQSRRLRKTGVSALVTAPLPEALVRWTAAGVRVLEDRRVGDTRTVTVQAPDEATALALSAAFAEAGPDGWEVSVPTLEDVFVAAVRRPVTV